MSNNTSDSSPDSLIYCFESRLNMYLFTVFFTINSCFIPLFILVLYTGYQRCSGSTMVKASNLDIFTYNEVVLELIFLLACCFSCYGMWTDIKSMLRVGQDMFYFTSPGLSLFHVLTCVEHYLAVVHPITYRSLTQAVWVRTRNICIGCVWMLCFMVVVVTEVFSRSTIITLQVCILVFFLSIVSFCSLSVLKILIRPGPGEGGHVDQSKQRAFHTITVIMGILWLRFVGVLVSRLLSTERLTDSKCTVILSTAWLVMPGSLVLPLLFLHRARKLPGCKSSTGSG